MKVPLRASLLVLAAAMLLAAAALEIAGSPSLTGNTPFSAAFVDRSGRLLRLTLANDERYRLWVPLSDMPSAIVEATLLKEDRFFYWHPGVNPWALTRAALETYVLGGRRLGASTITMQLARLRHRLDTRSISGKVRQILEALRLEWHHSKDEILEAYLNLAPYGGNVEGVGAAAAIYFRKHPKDLTVAEALVLAVLPQDPTGRSRPGGGNLMEAASRLERAWIRRHPEDRDTLSGMTGKLRLTHRAELPFEAPHLTTELAARRVKGYVATTLDLSLQHLLERQIAAYVKRRQGDGIHNASAILVDHRTWEVLALVGSVDFGSDAIQGQVDGTRGSRSPGSTLKPFIYGLAFDQGLLHPSTVLKDAPTPFGEWEPENFDRGFAGPLTVREALIRSRNVPAIDVANRLKEPDLYGFLKKAGVRRLRSPEFYGLALALGGAEVTMRDLARLYAMLGAGGELRDLVLIKGEDGPEAKTLISPEASELVLDILRDNPRPASPYDKRWTAQTVDVAWKTGTSFGFRDAWAAGVFGPYVLVVWVGNFDGQSNPAFVGREAAGPLFFEIVDAIRGRHGGVLPAVPMRKLPRLVETEVCAVSGALPGRYCQKTRRDLVIPGVSPIHTCAIHRPVPIDSKTGLRACPASGLAHAQTKVFEFWESDLLRLFRQAGIPRRVPPPWHPLCEGDGRTLAGREPKIVSPKPGVDYVFRVKRADRERIPLRAVTDADARELHWFAGNEYLGRVDVNETLLWAAAPGEYVLRAVDDLGRATSGRVRVRLAR